ncbi:hypothetical protein NDU88_010333 [Pleurodeles waltl]|uniref:Uncharacterized protein n=1 Tax=Pleurodeles waltl TaxID=8319 RepID=A0AAV7QU74_PLEWA|nr:hypothetical protein NDU88_010333 [Pleurodeles waltl]
MSPSSTVADVLKEIPTRPILHPKPQVAPPGPYQPATRVPRPTGGAQGQVIQDRTLNARNQPPAPLIRTTAEKYRGPPHSDVSAEPGPPQPSPEQHAKAASPGTSEEGTLSRPGHAARPQGPRSLSQGPAK